MTSKAHRLRRGLVLATVIGALAAPAASAAPIDPAVPGTGGQTNDRPNRAYIPRPAHEPVAVAGDGFDWGDAGIGAAGMLALAAIGGGAAIAVRHRPGRETVAQRAH